MDVLRPGLARTCFPGFPILPAADLDRFLTAQSSIPAIARFWLIVVGGAPAEGACLESGEPSQGRIQPPLTQGTARHPETPLEGRALVAVLTLLHPAAARRFPWCDSTSSNSGKRTERQKARTATPSALSFPALNDGACRAAGQPGRIQYGTTARETPHPCGRLGRALPATAGPRQHGAERRARGSRVARHLTVV